MIHLTPSNCFFPVLLVVEGLEVLVVLAPLAFLLRLAGFAGGLGLVFFSRRDGFLCVICDLSTRFRDLVIPSP